MQQHVGDLLGYASSNRAGDPVYCVDCAAELFPDTTHSARCDLTLTRSERCSRYSRRSNLSGR